MKVLAVLAVLACQFLGCHVAPSQRWTRPQAMAKPLATCVKPDCCTDCSKGGKDYCCISGDDHPCRCPPDTRAPR